MKVGTDACILGAWFANRIVRGGRVLDIGSGTGLLMLMLAQQHDGSIEGIELQESCFKQLRSNLESSPWSDRLRAWHGDVKKFETGQRFDFIVSNPPFFEDDLHSPSSGKNLAKHSTELTLDELLLTIDRLLTGDGHFGVLLPHHRTDYFIGLAKSLGFYMK